MAQRKKTPATPPAAAPAPAPAPAPPPVVAATAPIKGPLTPSTVTLDPNDPEDAWVLMRHRLAAPCPFFNSLIAQAEVIFDVPGVDRAATDGNSFFINAPWFLSQKNPARAGAGAHEALHCVLEHPTRRGNREPQRWNIAGDIVINGIIDDYFGRAPNWRIPGVQIELPDNVVRRADLQHLDAYEIYEILEREEEAIQKFQQSGKPPPWAKPQQGGGGGGGGGGGSSGQQPPPPPPPQKGQGGGKGTPGKPQPGGGGGGGGAPQKGDTPPKGAQPQAPPGMEDFPVPPGADPKEFWGSHGPEAPKCYHKRHGDGDGDKDGHDHSAEDEEFARKAAAKWRNAAQRAADEEARKKGQGSMPGNVLRRLGIALNEPEVDWRQELFKFVTKSFLDFTGPYDRRFFDQGYYFETLESETVRVYVAIDTSGSVSESQMGAFLSELKGILRDYPGLDGIGWYIDAQLHGPFKVEEMMEREPLGGGGTDFTPFFEEVNRLAETDRNGVCIYLTDGYGTFPDKVPVLDTLWVVLPGGLASEKFPFGKVIRLIKSQS